MRSCETLAGVKGIVAGPGGGERVARGARHHRILAELPELEVIELSFGPKFVGEGETFTAGPGTYVAAPVGVVHGFRNRGPGELRMLNIHGPNTGFAERL